MRTVFDRHHTDTRDLTADELKRQIDTYSDVLRQHGASSARVTATVEAWHETWQRLWSSLDTVPAESAEPVLRILKTVLPSIVNAQLAGYAKAVGRERRAQVGRRTGGRHAGPAKLKIRAALFNAIATLKTENPLLKTDRDAAREYLKAQDTEWRYQSPARRQQLIANVVRRIVKERRARKTKTPHRQTASHR